MLRYSANRLNRERSGEKFLDFGKDDGAATTSAYSAQGWRAAADVDRMVAGAFHELKVVTSVVSELRKRNTKKKCQ